MVFILTSSQLNVQTPSDATEPLPVLVWIHGGKHVCHLYVAREADGYQAVTA